MAGLAAGLAEARRLKVERIRVPLAEPAALEGLQVLHVSDTHVKGPRDWPIKALGELRGLAPDILVATGDLITGPGGLPPVARALGRVRPRLAAYVVPGNHDHWHQGHLRSLSGAVGPFVCPAEFAAVMAEHGLTVLANAAESLETGRGSINVVGMDDPYLSMARPEIAYSGLGEERPTLVLAHSPDAAALLQGRRCELLLCGHTHGGQILPPGGLPPLTTNTRLRLPAPFGLMVLEGILTHVSAGVGTANVPLRINCPPRATLLRIVAV